MAKFLNLHLFRSPRAAPSSHAEKAATTETSTSQAASAATSVVHGATKRLARNARDQATFGESERAVGPSLRDDDQDDKVHVGPDPRVAMHYIVEKKAANKGSDETTDPGPPPF